VDNYRGELTRSPLLEVADVVKVDVRALPGPEVAQLVRDCRAGGAVLLAADVRDAETLQRCAELGFELFQGEYLQRPATLRRRVLSPSQLICTRLLNELGDPDAPMQRIEQLVGSDPGLVLRLLRSAHSAAGAGQEVESLRQALVLIGPRLLRSWVVLTLLDGTSTMNASDDLWTVLARAKACQRLALGQPDLAYTIGLLVGAAELLGTDPATVADASGIGPEARASLLHGDGEAGRALQAVLAHERHDGPAIDAVGLSRYDVSQTYLHSLQEALQLVHDIRSR
jgi:EAL and modified HD-GYP domain-containing signal transduction protein